MAWRPSTKVFPYKKFPEPSIIDNGDNAGTVAEEIVILQPVESTQTTCVVVWIGNGACNRENNKAECDWDGGDCCRESCLKNCGGPVKNKTCKFECGTFNGYQCMQPNQGCAICHPTQGVCRSQDQCLTTHKTLGTAEQVFKRLIDYCWSVDWSMGNYQTVDKFCGKDPFKQIVHDIVVTDLHYEGCGLSPTLCTAYPACDDILRMKYGRNQGGGECDNKVKTFEAFDITVSVLQNFTMSCAEYFNTAFLSNYMFYGQCCQCIEGWTGISCDQAVCYPKCQHGTCVLPNVCKCEPGWQGLLCQLGICKKCLYGVCIAPETCDCFYGYEGVHCDKPISIPPCHRGYPDRPDHCVCDEGWQGRICDRPICAPDCGPHGHCVEPEVCECDIGWESSRLDQPCDITNPLLHDPNCVEAAVTEHCTACDYEFYLDPVTHKCHRCNLVYDQMCFECDHLQCLECQWPYIVDPVTSECLSGGVVEFTNQYLDVIEDQLFFQILVRRNFAFNGTISVRYDMTTNNHRNDRIQKRDGTLVWYDQQEIAILQFDIYKRLEFESASNTSMLPTEDTVWRIWLEYPSHMAEIGYRDHMLIHYFDSPLLTDIRWTYPTFFYEKENKTFFPNETQGLEYTPELLLGQIYTIEVHAFYLDGIPKTDGSELYYLIQLNVTRHQVREVVKSTYVGGNKHRIDFPVYELQLKFMHVYASAAQGYFVRYHNNTKFQHDPVLERIENFLPVDLMEPPLITYDKYSANYTFVAEFNTTPFPREEIFTFYLNIAENALAKVFLNDTLILEAPEQSCMGDFDRFPNGTFDGTSCCARKYNHSRPMSGGVPFHFRIQYIQRQPAHNGPCIRLAREAVVYDRADPTRKGLALDSIDREARAIQQLKNSPFFFNTLISEEFISANYSSFSYFPQINVNTGQSVSQKDFQTCAPNLFQVIVRDNFGVETTADNMASLQARVFFTIGNTTIETETYFNQTDKRRYFTIDYCGPIGQANLTVYLKDDLVPPSPRLFNVIPGPWKLAKSDFSEWNQGTSGCQAHQKCLVQLIMRDQASNYVDLPGIFNEQDADFQLMAKNVSANNSVFFQTFTVAKQSKYEIYPEYIASQPGLHDLYIRFAGQRVKVYPLQLRVYSTIANASMSYIVESTINSMRQASVPLIFHVQLCDKLGNKLTDFESAISTYVFDVRLHYSSDQSYVVYQTSVEKVDVSLYRVELVTDRSGWYTMSINVRNTHSGFQTQLYTKILDHQYWQSYLADGAETTAQGSAIFEVYTVSREGFAVQIRDPYKNKFNATYHQKNYTEQNPFLKVSLITDTGVQIVIQDDEDYPDVGLFTFTFAINNLYNKLVLTISVFKDGSYQNIQKSPFTLTMVQRDPLLMCSLNDIYTSGYGIQPASYLYAQPSVVTAGQTFTVTLYSLNKYKKPYQPILDPIQQLFTLDYAISDCICSNTTTICHHFSNNYDHCLANKQCKWDHRTTTTKGASIDSCKTCAGFCKPPEYIKTVDAVYTYLTTSIRKQGTHLAQLNVVQQGNLRMLIYETNNYADYYGSANIRDLSDVKFSKDLNAFFSTKRYQWSTVILGQLRFTERQCVDLIENRVHIVDKNRTLVTWLIESDLRVEVYLDNQLMLQKDQSTKEAQFQLFCSEMQLILFDLRISFDKPLPTKSQGYFRMFQETFTSVRSPLLPMNMFHFLPMDTTLETQITVLPDRVTHVTSEFFVAFCPTDVHRVPYNSRVYVKALDQFGNQRSLEPDQQLLVVVQKDGVIEFTKVLMQFNLLDYETEIEMTEAFVTYEIYATLNGIRLQKPSCFLTTKNQVIAPISETNLIQLGKYWTQDQCTFENELSYVKVRMVDQYANIVPLADREMYERAFTFAFELGSDFSSLQCKDFESPNIVVCPIRPLKSGIQQLAGSTNAGQFQSRSINVHSSLQRQIDLTNASHFSVQQTDGRITLKIKAVSAFGEAIGLQKPCTYFTHERLVFWIDTEVYYPTFEITTVTQGWLTLKFDYQSYAMRPDQVQLRLLDGVLLANGILVEYYSNDNLVGEPFDRRIVTQTEDSYRPATYDRYSFRATMYVRAPFSETYHFSARAGSRIYINSREIVADGAKNGSFFLSSQVWTFIEIQQRVSDSLWTLVQSSSLNQQPLDEIIWQAVVPNEQAIVIDDLIRF